MHEPFFDINEKRTQMIHYINLYCPYIKRAINHNLQKIDLQFETTIRLDDGQDNENTAIKVFLRHTLDNSQKTYSERTTSKVSLEKALDNLEETVKERYTKLEKLATPFEDFVQAIGHIRDDLSQFKSTKTLGMHPSLYETGIANPKMSLGEDGEPVVKIQQLKGGSFTTHPIIAFKPLHPREPATIDIDTWGHHSKNMLIISQIVSAIQKYMNTSVDFKFTEIQHMFPEYTNP